MNQSRSQGKETTESKIREAKEKLHHSRERLLDISLRNRLLNFRPGNPAFRDDIKAHKHVVLKGHLDSVWDRLVESEKQVEIVCLTPHQQQQISSESRSRKSSPSHATRNEDSKSLAPHAEMQWADIESSIYGVGQTLQNGNLISLLPEEAFSKRLKKVTHEQNTLINSTGDSALFLALGFLEWCEPEGHARAGEPLFAPLVLVHVNISHQNPLEGGERSFHLRMDADQPQGNPCLAEKLRRDFGIELPELEENELVTNYLSRTSQALRKRKVWQVHKSITLGFFNFARYRLWLDLNPDEWPDGQGPIANETIQAILNGEPLPQEEKMPSEEEVAQHQETQDLPLILDADSTQYAALLAASRGASMVIQGPPGSGKSQTIANLIAICLSEGKRVLFVAQKLPALQVVQRRLDAVGLGSFCLPLFSDKARVTAVHEHLAKSARLRESPVRWRDSKNQAAPLATHLNGHASRLRGRPSGFQESVCQLIQRATGLQLSLQEQWGEHWSAALLEVDVPDGEPAPAWSEKREQALNQWHRLRAEVGNTWSNWLPLELAGMDAQKVEAVISQQKTAATDLIESLGLIPCEFRNLTVPRLEKLLSQIDRAHVTVLQTIIPKLIDFLWKDSSNSAAVARLERDLEEFARQLSKAERCLQLSKETRTYVADKASEGLKILSGILSPRCSLTTARTVLEHLAEILGQAEDLVGQANLRHEGIIALATIGENSSSSTEFCWKHVEMLSSREADLTIHVVPGTKLALARYVVDDASRYDEAQVFVQRLRRFYESTKRLSESVGCLEAFRSPENTKKASLAVSNLHNAGLGGVRIAEFDEVTGVLKKCAEYISISIEKTPAGLADQLFGRQSLDLGDFKKLAVLAHFQRQQLSPPINGTQVVLKRVASFDQTSTRLRAAATGLEEHFALTAELRSWFPTVIAGQELENEFRDRQARVDLLTRTLGIQDQSVNTLPSLVKVVSQVRQELEFAIESTKNIFTTWPHVCPQTVGELGEARTVFLHLSKRPFLHDGIAIENLVSATSLTELSSAMNETAALKAFRSSHEAKVAFRDIPGAEVIASVRREIRPFQGRWWRHFSRRYRKAKGAILGFVNPPLPRDTEILALLEEIEIHERRCVALEGSPAKKLLGAHFKEIETDWGVIAPTIHWLQDLRTMTKLSDISALVRTSLVEKTIEAANRINKSIESLQQNVDALRSIRPLAEHLKNPQEARLIPLLEALSQCERDLDCLLGSTIECTPNHPEAKLCDFVVLGERLNRLKETAQSLKNNGLFVSLAEAVQLEPESLNEAAAWLDQLANYQVCPELVAAMAQQRIDDSVLPLISAANELRVHLDALQQVFREQGLPSWASQGSKSSNTNKMLHDLIVAATDLGRISQAAQLAPDLTIKDIERLLTDHQQVGDVKDYFIGWKSILLEEPTLISPEDIETTLTWLSTLYSRGAQGEFLRWLLSEETDDRLAWWQEIVFKSSELCTSVRKLQANFIIPIQDSLPGKPVAQWIVEVANRNAKTVSALDVIESCSGSPSHTLADLNTAIASLLRALELEGIISQWKDRLGVDPVSLTSRSVQAHRQWIAAVRNIPPNMGEWLTQAETGVRSEILVNLAPQLEALKESVAETKKVLTSFGRIRDHGPFNILDLTISLGELEMHCREFINHVPLLPSFAAMLREEQTATQLGITNILEGANRKNVSTDLLLETFRGAVCYQQAKSVWEADDELRYFRSNEHERLRQKFQQQDEWQLKYNRDYAAAKLSNSEVTEGYKGRTAADHTNYALLRREMGKKRRHLPIRKLVDRAGNAIQDLCPCWMMNPLACAQFLKPGVVDFDIVIMDEASQLNPEDAWGAIARGKQLVVVGDPKHMPPSDFFTAALEDDENPDEEEEIDGGKAESILDAAQASVWSSLLQWHYRSRQETLIAPANSFSYDNRLVLFPHPHRNHPELGIRYKHIANATVTTGKVINVAEAEAVANRVREIALFEYSRPAKHRLSLGVVTMNLHQQDCIIDLLTEMRGQDRAFDLAMGALEAGENEEPLFIRNLENIQGDERDIMILSCTYGPQTPGGTPAQRFGPLNREGGERRFNVLITRAKCRMEVFASLRSDQIVVDGKRQGVRDFHLFLKYAESGVLETPGETTSREADSPFEIQVEAVLIRAGFSVARQVGVAGYFIDLAVKHPQNPGLFAIGVECDGETYHSSRAARDRDRLRESILRERGWNLHRIWSTDWFVNPQQEKAKLIDAVQAACR
jgi:very-short-patch-repair endonuclease